MERRVLLQAAADELRRGGNIARGGAYGKVNPPKRARNTMTGRQKALIVTTGSAGASGLEELNQALALGWRVAHLSPMGGCACGAPPESAQLAALVVLERNGRMSRLFDQIEEEAEEFLEDIVEGDGSHLEIDPDIEENPPLNRESPR